MSQFNRFAFRNPRSARKLARRTRRTAVRRSIAARPSLESLDERCLLSSYSVTDLRSLAGVPCEAKDLNDAGQVVGMTYVPSAAHAILWNGSVVTDLGTLGGPNSSPAAINNVGQIVGWADRSDGARRGFLINPEDTDGNNLPDRWFRDLDANGVNDLMVELPLQDARGINNLGQVVGSGMDSNGNYLWTPNSPNGTSGSLRSLDFSPAAINDAGQVVGAARLDIWYHAVLWRDGVTTDLGYGVAYDINASGQIVGYSEGLASGFLWTPNVPNRVIGTFNDLESIFDPALWSGPGDSITSTAVALNNAGQPVGKSTLVSRGGWGEGGHDIQWARATLWDDGSPTSLSELGVPGTILIDARAINDSGQIIAHRDVNAFEISDYPYLLTPSNQPGITIDDVTVVEGHSGSAVASFTVRLDPISTDPVTVRYATVDGTAEGSDYVATSGTLTIPAGATTGTITIAINGDRLAEPNETFVVSVSNPTNATIVDNQGVGTITDDEPRISIRSVTRKEGKANQNTLFTFTVTLSAAYDQAVTVSFKTVNGTATTNNRDYVSKAGTLTFRPGETTRTISIFVRGDSRREANETFYVDLFDNSGNSLFAKKRGIGTILNDD